MIARRGRGGGVLMLHGAGGGGWEWNVWRGCFAAQGFTVAAPDLQPAADGIEATRLDDYRRQAVEAARALGSRPVMVGASLGGLLASSAAGSLPCAALVLVNPMPPLPEACQLPPRAAHPPRLPWYSRGRFAQTAGALPDADAAARLYAHRRWRDESGAALDAACAGIRLSPADCPVLVIASANDRDVPATLSEELARRLGATLLTLQGSHLDPLLGRSAHEAAKRALGWLNCIL
jgi:pimeloyl-ACP methyl ester carboxylesterase